MKPSAVVTPSGGRLARSRLAEPPKDLEVFTGRICQSAHWCVRFGAIGPARGQAWIRRTGGNIPEPRPT